MGLPQADGGFDLRGRHRATGAADLSPTFEEHEGWNALDLESARDLGDVIGIELGDDERSGTLVRELLELGAHDPAGAAPGGPKVDEHRHRRLRHDLVEFLGRRNRVGQLRSDGALAVATFALLSNPRKRKAILRATRGTAEDHGVAPSLDRRSSTPERKA